MWLPPIRWATYGSAVVIMATGHFWLGVGIIVGFELGTLQRYELSESKR